MCETNSQISTRVRIGVIIMVVLAIIGLIFVNIGMHQYGNNGDVKLAIAGFVSFFLSFLTGFIFLGFFSNPSSTNSQGKLILRIILGRMWTFFMLAVGLLAYSGYQFGKDKYTIINIGLFGVGGITALSAIIESAVLWLAFK